ncbi:hypothetical protein RYX36_006918, partial [Vicia faba]
MVSANDPVESFFNSIQVMKESLLPFELGFRKAANSHIVTNSATTFKVDTTTEYPPCRLL